LFINPAAALASGGGLGDSESGDITATMAQLVLQLGVIVMIARLIGRFSQAVKLPFPSVLLEVVAGIAIGPYMLGGVPLPGFPEGIFPLASASGIPVSPELYGIATIASLIMLFSVGLETDLALLLKFSFVGLLVGFSGVILPFAAAAVSTSMFFGYPISHPTVLFIGVVCMATSVGITARIISDLRKMGSPEAVTILAAAVIDDVLSIIALTIVISFIAAGTPGAAETPGHSVWVISKAVLVWLGFTIAGILFAGPISKAIKSFKSVASISIAALGIAFILAGIFQMAGLAMVIGAYVMGLSLSKTDLTDTVRDTLGVLHSFFVPVFFIVMGMLVNPHAIMSKEVLIFGVIYTAAALLTNIVAGAVPALFLNFNRLGALRIGIGMIPRGEVALIIAGIGLSSGIIDQRFFGACMVMVLGSILVAPPFISALFRIDKKGTKKEFRSRNTVATPINFPSRKLAVILEQQLIHSFRSEGFFVHSIPIGSRNIFHMRKNDIHITLQTGDNGLLFESDAQDVVLIKNVAYEALLHINDAFTGVKELIKPESMLKDLAADTTVIAAVENGGGAEAQSGDADANGGAPAQNVKENKDGKDSDTAVITKRKMDAGGEFKHALTQGSIIPTLTGSTKREIVEKLVGILHSEGIIKDAEDAVNAVMERETSMSTGMQHGIALPHARTDAVDKITVAVGLSKNGIDYKAFDGQPSKIFVLILSPLSTDSPHIQFLAKIATMLNGEEAREKLLNCFTQEQIYEFFRERLKN
jgi:Kef-type K+ transport system membrane component KefB/mannitol/fructose-specific phosphotransferase system IIA component (Ntr-type)